MLAMRSRMQPVTRPLAYYMTRFDEMVTENQVPDRLQVAPIPPPPLRCAKCVSATTARARS